MKIIILTSIIGVIIIMVTGMMRIIIDIPTTLVETLIGMINLIIQIIEVDNLTLMILIQSQTLGSNHPFQEVDTLMIDIVIRINLKLKMMMTLIVSNLLSMMVKFTGRLASCNSKTLLIIVSGVIVLNLVN